MKLSDLLQKISPLETRGSLSIDINGVNMDSRLVEKGNLFVAVKGTQADGHAFIAGAIEKGASAILVSEPIPAETPADVTFVRVADTEDAIGKVATTFYGDPTQRLKLVGVTGTNGKTTIATVLYYLFTELGFKCGLCSTVCNYIGTRAVPTEHTTPDPVTLNKLLGEMADEGCEYAFMECSSHAIHQKRIGGLDFAGALFTNLTRDHLDYHKTLRIIATLRRRSLTVWAKTLLLSPTPTTRTGQLWCRIQRLVSKRIPREQRPTTKERSLKSRSKVCCSK